MAIQCSLGRPVPGGSTEIPPPHCIYFLTLLAQINLSTVGLNLDFWRSLRPSCTTQEFSVPRHVSRAQWEEKLLLFQAFSGNAQLSVDQESSSRGVWDALGWVTFFLPSGSLFMVWGLLVIASGETVISIRRREPELLQLFQRFPPWKPFKFVAPLCAMLISIWLWIVDGYFLLNESVVWVKNISGGREIGLFFFWNRCPMSYFFIWGEIFCRLQKLTALSR